MRSAEGRGALLASGIPVVETWDLTPTPVDMLVGFSHEKVGTDIANFLYSKGYRRPAVITGDDQRANLRRAGFEQAWQALGGQEPEIRSVAAPTTLGRRRTVFAGLLAEAPDIDVVVCSSDALAHGVITEAQARGMQVPQDIAAMGFGDLGFARHAHPAISTVRIDGTAIGRQAARFIIDRADGRPVEQKVIDLGFSLVERASA
jgi:LacI family gluconate utilization system Gnt-I transcriptional repressor